MREDARGREIMERADLEPFVAYYEEKSDSWFVSPDGVGCFWYDTFAELEYQHGKLPLGESVFELEDF